MKTLKFPLLLIFYLNCTNCINGQGGWEVVSGAPTSSSRFDDVSFINDSVGFILGEYNTYKTVDQGETWIPQKHISKSLHARSLEFIDDSLGFAGVFSSPEVEQGLYVTTDGGNSYENINYKFQTPLKGICGLDHKGNTIIGVGIYSEPAFFILSKDRGKTWNFSEVALAKGLVDCIIINDSTYLASGTTDNGEGKSSSVILKTNDYGKNWRVVADNGKKQTYCWKLFMDEKGFGIGSIEFSDHYFVTFNFGDDWNLTKINGVNATFSNFGGTSFLNDSIGWLGYQWNSGLLETKNGGLTWKGLSFGNNINRIIILDQKTALAVGSTIYKYKAETLGTKKNIQDLPFHTYSLSPNPVTNKINFKIDLFTGTELRLDLVNEEGIMKELLFREVLSSGKHNITFDVSHIPSGVYFVWLRCNQGHPVIKTIIQH